MANCGIRENEWFACPTHINVSGLFIALHLSGTSIAYEPEQAFSSEHAIQDGCAGSGRASSGGDKRSTCSNVRSCYENSYQNNEARRQESYTRRSDFFDENKATTHD